MRCLWSCQESAESSEPGRLADNLYKLHTRMHTCTHKHTHTHTQTNTNTHTTTEIQKKTHHKDPIDEVLVVSVRVGRVERSRQAGRVADGLQQLLRLLVGQHRVDDQVRREQVVHIL